jgi:hypothetical protein
MDALTKIREKINDFPGYGVEADLRRADAEIRSYVGERLAELQQRLAVENLAAADSIEPAILRSAFANQRVIVPLERPDEDLNSPELLEADVALLDLADDAASVTPATLQDYLKNITAAFDARDAILVQAGVTFK